MEQPEKLPPLPPVTACQGLVCYKCFKDDVLPSRCVGCHRISYCSPGALSSWRKVGVEWHWDTPRTNIFSITECQKVDWKLHKLMCKALNAIEKGHPIVATLLSILPTEPITDVEVLNGKTALQISHILKFCRHFLHQLATGTLFERELVIYEPRCMVCTRTDQLIRIEAARMGAAPDDSRRLIPCSQCNLSFCCSSEHWETARMLRNGPCEDAAYGRDGLSQCEMNVEVRAYIKSMAVFVARNVVRPKLGPRRSIKSAWTTLTATSWEGEFGDEIRTMIGLPALFPLAPILRAASDDLTMAMTILYGLEKLNDDDGWTRNHTLTIHVIGAGLFEILKCGPDMPRRDLAQRIFNPETCSLCTQRGRKRVTEHGFDTYHEFVAKKGNEFEKPDLCIAFNSGASQASQHTWPPTLKLLVDRKIPTVFTVRFNGEAECEAALLRAAGAKLHPDLGPAKNPWGSMDAHPRAMKLYGFYVNSGWLAGGFR
ncbi:hypothetical protein DFH06DRAFT_1107996 [Mycena polygramma]|nr:hypothetical protein DFH06DRAFT_1107996 [Mycena polygramma]